MDENNNEYIEHKEQNNYYEHHHEKCFLCKHPFLKTLLTALATLLGAYLAFYVVTDWHYKRMFDPLVQMKRMDRMIQKEEHQMHKMFNKELRREKSFNNSANKIINVEKTRENYKIIVDLKSFDKDEKNVQVTREGNSLTVNIAGEVKKYLKDLQVHITQKFIFPDDANLDNISKFKDGDNYYIVIPIED